VEAEIGALAAQEAGVQTDPNAAIPDAGLYTKPEDAERFVNDTIVNGKGIDALACSFGTAHGFYKAKPKLDFPRIAKIRTMTGKPLVMHGGSGVPPEDYTKAIAQGVRKINYYSYMSRAGVDAVKALFAGAGTEYYHEAAQAAVLAMKENVKQAMEVFYREKE
jgi:fructose-bisphosphate aldolase class II